MCFIDSGIYQNRKCFVPCADDIKKCGNCSCQNRILNRQLSNDLGEEEMLKVKKMVEEYKEKKQS